MNSMIVSGIKRLVVIAAAILLAGCYYMQAVSGHLEIMRRSEPIAEVLAGESTPEALSSRLRLVTEARQFAVDVLGLPDNDSYRSYADLERDFVVWNVIAVPEFSLQPKTWCYPVAGCVSYRGYFSQAAAERKAAALRRDGYDIAFGGVVAYSTLGEFADPVLSTMMNWRDTDLVAIMFHELAHQVLYVKDDTEFNESFATTVEEAGLERWLDARAQADELRAWQERRTLRADFAALVAAARSDLDVIYGSGGTPDDMRVQKQRRLETFANDAKCLYAASGQEAPAWLDAELNNARLVATTLYHGRVAAFRTMLAACGGEMRCFYKAAKKLADST